MGLALCAKHTLQSVNVQMRLSEQFLQLSVLALKLFQSLGVRHIHTAVLGAPLVEAGVTEAVLAAQLLHRHASFRLPQKANDLFFPVRDVASSARAVSAVHRCVEPHDTPADKIWLVQSLNFLIAPTLFASYAYRL